MKLWVSALVLPAFLVACGGGGAQPDTELTEEEVRVLSAGIWLGETQIQGVAGASYQMVALSYEDRFFSVLDLGGAFGKIFYDSDVEVIDQYQQDGKVVWDTFSVSDLFQAGRKQVAETEIHAESILRERVEGTFESPDTLAGGISGEIELHFSADPSLVGTLEEVSGAWGGGEAMLAVNDEGAFSGSDGEVVGFGRACNLSGTLTELEVGVSLFEANLTLTACVQSDRNGSYSGLAAVMPLGESGGPNLYLMTANEDRAYFGAFASSAQ